MTDSARLALENVLRHLYEQQREYTRAQHQVAQQLANAQVLSVQVGTELARISSLQVELHDLRRSVANTILGLHNTQQTLLNFDRETIAAQNLVMDALGIVRPTRNTDDIDTNPGTPLARAKTQQGEPS